VNAYVYPDPAEGFDPARDYVTVCASSAFAQPGVRWQEAVPSFVTLCRRLRGEVAPVLLVAPCQVDAAILRKVQDELGLPLLGLHTPVPQATDVLANARARRRTLASRHLRGTGRHAARRLWREFAQDACADQRHRT